MGAAAVKLRFMRPLLLLTRPLPQAHHFAAEAQTQCPPHDLLIAPLSGIVPLAFDPAVFKGARGLLLTSVNAVPAVAQVAKDMPGIAGLPAFCVGPATMQAAQDAGFVAYNCGGDAVAMVAYLIARRPEGPLVHAHGVHLARDMVAALGPEGMEPRSVQVYEARATNWPPSVLTQLQARPAGQVCVVPLFSPRAALRFMQELQGAELQDLRMVAISAACADNLPPELRALCQIARTPDAEGMMAAIADVMSRIAADGLRQAPVTDK
ncbi:hypothetical protein DDE20_15585 [Pararhodobacter oceanensis]|uniref:Tetrapyrrole biosynthesis uroporphyrinogen III synthase domain-containing protein n=2 Tax=Pararhodobacter oceanensis TaxID=2172121 RepID=A0A2T8HQM6_9RHOB|nr:hypothetical protein DDE20_15585 [Pararhodobacter oceanensis]